MKKFFPVYPILLGIIWILVTYSGNMSKLPSFGVATVPLLVVTGIIAAIWGITQLLVRDWRKSALIVAVIFCLTIFHGYIRDFTGVNGISSSPIWLALMVVGVFVAAKLTRPKGRIHLTVVANVVCVAILFVSSYSILTSPNGVGASTDLESQAVPINGVHNPLPDIYYIIPDTYASFGVLEDYLGYDNSEFLNFLQDRGFYVQPDSMANYHHSILSISSVLNMKYWTDEELGSEAAKYLGQRLLQNPVGDTVKEAGYTYVHLGSWWSFTSANIKADIEPEFSSLNEFAFTLYRTTLWYDLADFTFGVGGNSILRDAHLRQFDSLVAVSKMEEPTFTFCHFILPHPPFLFGADGEHTSGWMLPPEEWERMYLDQLTFTTTKLEKAIDEILANSKVAPIIILCSDEGYSSTDWQDYWASKQGLDTILEDRPDLAIERQGNLLAVLNPYGDMSQLKSPVNVFRVLFNDLFSSNLEILPDKYFLKSLDKFPGKFIDVTKELTSGKD